MKLIDIEKAVLKEVVGPWKRDVDAVKEAIFLLYSPYMGQTLTEAQAKLIVYRVLQFLDTLEVPEGISDVAMTAVVQSHKWGLARALRGLEKSDELPANIPVSKNSTRTASTIEDNAKEALRLAKENMRKPGAADTFEDLLQSIQPIVQNPTRMTQALTYSVNNAANSAISKVALKADEKFTWVSERDGCVHCLAYSGVQGNKTGFQKGLTFGKKPLTFKGTLPHPPLHPNCRCEIEIGLSEEYAEALKRESIRSILRGTKLPSESEKVRLEAAARLAEMDVNAPKSVIKYAKDAVKRGSFDPTKKKAKK